jgi:drug/metabolite transporter (DMT)-like permease
MKPAHGPDTGRNWMALVAFFALSALAGGNGVAIRFSNRELPPLWGATVRFGLAAAVFVLLMAALRLSVPRGRELIGALLYGAFNFAGSFGLAYIALVNLHAGLAQTLLASVPLMTLLLAVIARQERLHLAAVAGTLLALAGIAVISRAPVQGSMPIGSLIAILASAFCIALAAVLVRRFPATHPIAMNAVGGAAGTVLLLLGAMITGERLGLPQHATTWLAIAYMVPFGTVLLFVLYLFVLRRWAASRAAYTFVLIPVFTVLLSAWLDNERLGPGLAFGALLVIAGVYVGALRPAPRSPT